MARLSFSNRLDVGIFFAMLVVLISLLALLTSNLAFQYLNYRDGIKLAVADPRYVDHASILTYSRAWDFAIVKTSALFLSFVLIFTGAMYVLRAGETTYSVSLEKGETKGSFAASSPGLVMLTLGVILAAYVISNKTYLEYGRQGLTQRIQSEDKPSAEEIRPSTPVDSTSAQQVERTGK